MSHVGVAKETRSDGGQGRVSRGQESRSPPKASGPLVSTSPPLLPTITPREYLPLAALEPHVPSPPPSLVFSPWSQARKLGEQQSSSSSIYQPPSRSSAHLVFSSVSLLTLTLSQPDPSSALSQPPHSTIFLLPTSSACLLSRSTSSRDDPSPKSERSPTSSRVSGSGTGYPKYIAC